MKKLIFLFILSFFFMGIHAQYAVITSAPVYLRDAGSLKGKKVHTHTENFTLVKLLSETKTKEQITIYNNEYYRSWSEIETDSVKAFTYSLFIETFETEEDANQFINVNKKFQDKYNGKYSFDLYEVSEFYALPTDENSQFCYDCSVYINFLESNKIEIEIEGVEGDHIVSEQGNGRFIVYNDNSISIMGGTKGEFAPDGYTWKEYYELAVGDNPSKEELDAYIKEKSTYKSFFKINISVEEFENLIKKAD